MNVLSKQMPALQKSCWFGRPGNVTCGGRRPFKWHALGRDNVRGCYSHLQKPSRAPLRASVRFPATV